MRIERLIERDGPACVWCGREVWREDLTAEHLLPRSKDGTGRDRNLLLACRSCNKERRSRPAAAYASERLAAGLRPRFDLLRAAFERLAQSSHKEERAYAARQRERLADVGVSR